MCRQNVFEGIIEINNSNRVSQDDVIYQLQCQVVSLKTEIFILSSQNKSLLEKLNQQNESYDKKINEIKSYDKQKYTLFQKK
jgi:hypothetical protein